MDEAKARERIIWLEEKQRILEAAVTKAERNLLALVIQEIEAITQDPALISSLFQTFMQTEYLQAIQEMIIGVVEVGYKNEAYFGPIFKSNPDFEAMKAPIRETMLKRFGLTQEAGQVTAVAGGYFDNLIKDTAIRQEVQEVAYRLHSSGAGLREYVSKLTEIIQGEEGQGVISRRFKQGAFDTYNIADASYQDIYSDKFGLQAALYLGGLIATSRPFCIHRNGKVFLKSEILLFGTSKDKYGGYTDKSKGLFSGKNKGYNPKTDRGGHACRHQYSYVSNSLAKSKRPDLEVTKNGVLKIKAA